MKKSLLTLMLCTSIANIANAQTCKDYITNNWQDSRYIDNGDETVTDTQTKLMWKKCAEGLSGSNCATGSATTMNWQSALALDGSTFAGKSDWRLPNVEELRSLVAYNCHSPSINITLFPNTHVSYFFSASPNAYDSAFSWLVYFDYGYDSGSYRTNSNRVRLVRGGE